MNLLLIIHVLGYILALPLVGWKWLIFPSLAAISLPVLPCRLPGKHPYWKLWFAGFCFWFYAAHFVRFPHWINYGLWFALAAYLGVYLPLFVSVSRTLYHRQLPRLFFPLLGKCTFSPVFRTLSFLFSVTMCWAACDVLRGWVFSGFMMGSASDVFYRDPLMIQTADLFGQWGVSAFLLYLSACVALFCKIQAWGIPRKKISRKFAVICLMLGLTFLFGYGHLRLNQTNPNEPCGTIALLQGNIPAELETTPELIEKTDATYLKLVEEIRTRGDVDLAVYPECIFRYPVLFSVPHAFQPTSIQNEDGTPLDSDVYQSWLARASRQSQEDLLDFARYSVKTQFLTGCSTFNYLTDCVESHNSAIFVGPETTRLDPKSVYHKMILVPFGEYIPTVKTLQKWFPNINDWFPIGSQDAGKQPVCVTFQTREGRELHASLSICYESALSRLTRRQIAGLRKNGQKPDCIINLTNNGWFRQSHETRFHEACGVFRAIENRMPLLTAANWGVSVSIDSNGRILGEIPTGKTAVLYTTLQPDPRHSFFTRWGGILLWVPLVVLFWGISAIARRSRGV